MPFIRSDDLDKDAWEKIEQLLRNPEVTLDLLQQVQAQQMNTHVDAVMNLDLVETVRAKYHDQLKARYQDYKDGLVTKEIYLEEKAGLDQRLQDAEKVHQEYQKTVDRTVLSDQAIKQISGECRKFADYLDQAGELTFEHKRALIDLWNVTGQFKVEDGWLVLYLSIHSLDFEKLVIREMQSSQNKARE